MCEHIKNTEIIQKKSHRNIWFFPMIGNDDSLFLWLDPGSEFDATLTVLLATIVNCKGRNHRGNICVNFHIGKSGLKKI